MRVVAMLAANERHYCHARFEAAKPERKLWKENEACKYRGADSRSLVLNMPVAALHRGIPVANQTCMRGKIHKAADEHENVEHQIKPNDHHGDRNHFFEAAQEHRSQG